MALIPCPECGREISDKVTSCPHCGYPFEQPDAPSSAPQQVEVTSVKLGSSDPAKKKKTKKLILAAVVAVVAIFAVFFGVKSQTAANQRSQYIDNLSSVRMLMLAGAIDAEELCNLTKSVWYNTIFEESDSATDKYTKSSYGLFHSDFDTSISNLYADASTKETVSDIQENQSLVDDLMKDLQNPTEEFAACYETLDSLYDVYKTLTNLAVSPTGSLNTFSETFRDADSSFLTYFEKMETQIPEK